MSNNENAVVARAYAECERVMRLAARNFSYGIRLLPPDRRGALAAVYAFARRIDDIGDEQRPVREKEQLLDEARRDLKSIGGPTDDPVLIALDDAARRLPIPLEAFNELIEGVELDIRGATYETWPALQHYCRCVAGSIGRLSLGVFGLRAGADPALAAARADSLGIALQLTNILRDIREDLAGGRVYLPADDLRAAGAVLHLDPDGNVADDEAVVGVIRREAARAREWYAEGWELLPMLDRRGAACTSAMSGIYRRLLRRIDHDPRQVLRTRVSLSPWEKAYVAARSLAGVRP